MEEKLIKKSETTKKNKRSKKQRILLLLLLLLGTGVMLTTSTYAWFTANETVTINTINVNIEATGGLQISADGSNWKTILQNTDLTGAKATYSAAVNQIPASLEPVSSGLNVDSNGRMEMFYGSVVANATSGAWQLTAEQSVETNSSGSTSTGKFVAFDVFFKADSAMTLYMTSNSKVSTQDTEDKGIKNASRVAFVVENNTSASSDLTTIQGLNYNDAGNSVKGVYLWEPNYEVHTDYAVIHAQDTYGKTVHVYPNAGGTASPNAADSIDGVIAAIAADDNVLVSEATAAKFSTKFKAVTPTYKTEYDKSTSTQIFALAAGVTKVRIYMWVEGQDIDCENHASGGNIDFDLQFSKNA